MDGVVPLTKFLESFLMRDILSYLLSGFIELYLVTSTIVDDTTMRSVVTEVRSILGPSLTTALALGLSYIVGYMVSTLAFYVRPRITAAQRRTTQAEGHSQEELAELFGQWTKDAELSQITPLCANVLQIVHPQLYFEKIERRAILRNLEIGLFGLMLVISLTLVMAASGWHRLWSLATLLLAIALLVSSRRLDGVIDRLALNLFYAAAVVKKQGWPITDKS